jgi:hypothetical protein
MKEGTDLMLLPDLRSPTRRIIYPLIFLLPLELLHPRLLRELLRLKPYPRVVPGLHELLPPLLLDALLVQVGVWDVDKRVRRLFLWLGVLAQVLLSGALDGVLDLLDGGVELVVVCEAGVLESSLQSSEPDRKGRSVSYSGSLNSKGQERRKKIARSTYLIVSLLVC